MVIVFWVAIGFVVYTFVGYPILLWLLSRVRKGEHSQADIQPIVSVIIVAYNEGERIAAKIANTLEFDYPRDRLEIIVGSDGSKDSTAEIVRSFGAQGVKLVESAVRRGKHHIQMMARDIARGEILVFTDVSIMVDPEVLRKMVSHYADSQVGAVSSVDELLDAKKDWLGEHFYVYGEMGLRHLEGQVSSLVSVSGAFFSARRSLCEPWNPDHSSDFFVALNVAARKMRVIQDPECRARLGVVKSERAELSRKVRTIVHGLAVFFSHLSLLNPFRYGLFSWQLVSHKFFRWLLPFGLIAALVSNLFLWRVGRFYQVTLILQLVGYGIGLVSYAAGGQARSGLLRLASFVVLGNIATLLAWWKFCLGDKMVVWEPSRRN
jgi:glycosyltransferase involved in cell wall biosynthesis